MIEEILVDSNEEILTDCQENVNKIEQIEKHECKNENVKFGNVLFGRKTKVFAKVNSAGFVINVQSDVVLKDTTGWIQIDEGVGDRFVFAHTEYFDKPLIDEEGNYQIKLES